MLKAPGATPVDLSALWTVTGFSLRMLDLAMMRGMGERLAAFALTPAAATTLLVIERNPGIRLGQLADALVVQRPNMTKLIKRLEGQGLLRRLPAPNDRRLIELDLTDAGRTLVQRVWREFHAHDAEGLAVLSPEEQRLFVQTMHRVLAGIRKRARAQRGLQNQ